MPLKLSHGDLLIEVDEQAGGRITAFSKGGINILLPRSDHNNYGSTFWPSPQSCFGWPPPTAIDCAPYRVLERNPHIELVGDAATKPPVSVKKIIELTSNTTARMTYEMRNQDDEPLTLAPWEISRVGPHGLTFFAKGDVRFPSGFPEVPLVDVETISYFDFDAHDFDGHRKVNCDSCEGWLAHTDGRMLFLKVFPHIPRAQQAPGEALVELYADPTKTYIEIEQQGAYVAIEPGESVSWSVIWVLEKLPEGIEVSAGSGGLVRHVRERVAKHAFL